MGRAAPPEIRRDKILSVVSEREFVKVAEISEMFDVSTVTVRADLEALQTSGAIRRVHGGAVSTALRPERSFEETLDELADEKRRIATAAASIVAPHETLLLDVGSTTAAVARALVTRTELNDVTCFTNGVKIALELEPAIPRFSVVLTGGTLRPLQHSLVDPLAGAALDGLQVDTAFIGCNGVSVDGGVTNINLPEAAIKTRMIAAARRRVVVATGDKIGARSLARLCAISDVTTLITDDSADADEVAAMRSIDIDVLVV